MLRIDGIIASMHFATFRDERELRFSLRKDLGDRKIDFKLTRMRAIKLRA